MSATLPAQNQRLAKLANVLTIARIVLSPVLGWLIIEFNPSWGVWGFAWLLGLTDKLDGELARRAGPTRSGAFMDTLADKVLLIVAGAALIHVGVLWWVPMAIIAVREIGIMGYRVYWTRHSLAMPARKTGKYKAVLQGIALTSLMCPPLTSSKWLTSALVWVAVALTVFTAWEYLRDGHKALSTTGERLS